MDMLYDNRCICLWTDFSLAVTALVDRYCKLLERDIFFQDLSDHRSLCLGYNMTSLVDDLGYRKKLKLLYSFPSSVTYATHS